MTRHTVGRDAASSNWQQQGDDVLACARAAAERVDQLGLRGLFAHAWAKRCLTAGLNLQLAARIERDRVTPD